MERLLGSLQEIHRLLKRYEISQAGIVSQLIDLYEVNQEEFIDQLHSLELWGGAGSVADVAAFGGRRAMEPKYYEDTVRYHEAVIGLVSTMRALNIRDDRAEHIAETFRKWNKIGWKKWKKKLSSGR
jgi:hypothetical protein